MIVTTGGRSVSSESSSSYSGSSSTSSAAWMMSTFFSKPSASTSIASSVRVWVRVAISPSSISFLITSAGERPSDSATCPTVAPDWISVGGCSTGSSGGLVRSGSTHCGRRLRPRPRRTGCWGGGGPPGRPRPAWESITTRRRLPPAPGPLSPRVGRGRSRRGAPPGAPALGPPVLGPVGPLRRLLRLGSRLAVGAGRLAVAEGLLDVGFVHARGGRLDVETGSLELRQHFLAGDALLLRYFVDALLCHSPMNSMVSLVTVTGALRERP